MRLIQVLHGWPPESMGGTGLYVHALSHALMDAGHEVMHFAPGPWGLGGAEETADGSLLGWKARGKPPITWRGGWQRPDALKAWNTLLETVRPDLVHVHHLSGLPLGLIAATRAKSVPVALTLHDYWLPCHRGQLVTPELTLCDGPTAKGCAKCIGGRASALRRRDAEARTAAARRAVADASVVWSPSLDLAERFERMGFDRPEHCPLPLIQPIHPAAEPEEGPVRFLFASSLIPTKGPHILVDAFRKLDGHAQLSIAGHAPPYDGDHSFAQRLRKACDADPRIQWLGAVPSQQMPALISGHDVLVLPSIWPENSPLIVREATAGGLRVVGSRSGGTRELAPDANLVEPGDIDALHSALQAELTRGRSRNPASTWQTPEAHASWLLERYPTRDDPSDGD